MDSDRLKGTAQELGGKAQSGFGKVAGDDSSYVEGTAREMGGKAQNVFGQVKDQVRDIAGNAPGNAQDVYDNGGAYVRQSIDTVEKAVGKHPLTYVLVAAAAGYFLSLILNGSKR